MLNAIRIITGWVVGIYAIFITVVSVTFMLSNLSEIVLDYNFFANALIWIIPLIAAWLLLFPKNQKQAIIGLVIVLLYISVAVAYQITAIQDINSQY